MDWSKAKNYIIIFLVFLNLFLFICNIWFDKRYVITDQQIEAVKTILKNKNIKTDSSCEIPIDYKPMVQIRFDGYSYDEFNLQKIFFTESDGVKRTTDFKKTILSLNDEKISITEDIVEFESPNVIQQIDLNKEAVLKICEQYADRAAEFFDGMKYYGVNEYDDCFVVEYIGRYKGTAVFCNYMKFKILKDGGLFVKLRYFPIKNLYGNEVDICSADEALFIFSRKAREILGQEDITVSKIERGYYFDDFEKGDDIFSMPYYRIEILQREQPFFVNAYNRTLEEIN